MRKVGIIFRDLRVRLRESLKVLALSCVEALAIGYVVFYGVFPTVSFPASGGPSFLLIFAILGITSVLVGMASDNLGHLFLQCFFAVPLGGLVATLMALTPILFGVAFLAPDSLLPFLIHYGFILFVLGFVVSFIGGVAGLVLRERYFYRSPRAPLLR